VASRFDTLSPTALRMLRQIVIAAERHKVPLTLCGEMAGKPLEAMALVGLGYRSISMAPASIGPVKTMILALNATNIQDFLLDLIDQDCTNIRQRLIEFARANDVPV
jgi:phosphotransferase system enzyme I (PtsP)